MSIDSSKTKAVSMDSHHENRFLYIRYSPATPCHTWADSPGGWHALQKNCCVFCSVRTPVSPPFGQTRPLRGLKQCPRWRLAVQTSRRKPRNVFFAGHAAPARIQPQAVQCFRAGHATHGRIQPQAVQCFRARHATHGRIQPQAVQCFRAGHVIPWANPASSGAMFPCRVCHQGRISDRFIPAFR